MLKSVATPEHPFFQPQLIESTTEADTDYSMDSIPIPEFDIALAARIELALQPPTDVPEWSSYDNCQHKGCVQLYLDSWEAPCQDEEEDVSGWTYREPTSPSEVARYVWFIATRPVIFDVETYHWTARSEAERRSGFSDYTQCYTEYRTMSLDGLREEMAMNHYLQTVRSRGVYPSWEYQEGHAFSIQYMAQFILDYIAKKYSSYGVAIRDFISNAYAIEHHTDHEVVAYIQGIELQLAYEEFVEGLLEQALEPVPTVKYDAVPELVNRIATGEGLNESAYGFDDDENGASLVKALAQVKEMELPQAQPNGKEITVNFLGERVVPMIATVDPDTCVEYCHIGSKPKDKRGKAPVCQHYQYKLLSNAEVAKLVSWLDAKGQGKIARETVLQFPLIDSSRNRYLHQCERAWASRMVLHMPFLKLFLRDNLAKINERNGYRLPRKACKLVPIMDDVEDYLSIHKSAEWWLPNQDITNQDIFLRGFDLPDSTTASIKAQWAMILPMISETNASWLRRGKYIASAEGVLAGCKPAPGKVSKRVKLFTSPVVFALIPNEYSVKVIGADWVKSKITQMAQGAGVELTDDDFSNWKTETSPFDESGGIYVRRSFANAIWVMDSEGQCSQLSDGDKFTRLVGRFCAKGLVHVVDDDNMDADTFRYQ
jgi:hypothetical protein